MFPQHLLAIIGGLTATYAKEAAVICAEWDDAYVLGHATIDDHHRRMFVLVQDLGEMLNLENAGDRWLQAATTLIDHTNRHFEYEEQVMEEAAYPAAAVHRTQHTELLGELEHFCAHPHLSLLHGRDRESRGLSFLLQWLSEHVNHSDRKLADWLRSRS